MIWSPVIGWTASTLTSYSHLYYTTQLLYASTLSLKDDVETATDDKEEEFLQLCVQEAPETKRRKLFKCSDCGRNSEDFVWENTDILNTLTLTLDSRLLLSSISN